MRILVVEDDPNIALVQREALERAGFQVSVSATGAEAVEMTLSWRPDLVLLDQILPDIDGREVIRTIRASSRVPVIMVTAMAEETERVAGLDAGADDYVVKPFSTPELVARVRAHLRRANGTHQRSGPLSFKDLALDPETRRVQRGERAIDLTEIEFDLLRVLLQHEAGVVVPRQDVARAVWNLSASEVGKALDVHMSALRRKLGDDPKSPTYIETIRGVGFRLSR